MLAVNKKDPNFICGAYNASASKKESEKGLNSNSKNSSEIKIYPNPAKDFITLELGQ